MVSSSRSTNGQRIKEQHCERTAAPGCISILHQQCMERAVQQLGDGLGALHSDVPLSVVVTPEAQIPASSEERGCCTRLSGKCAAKLLAKSRERTDSNATSALPGNVL
ncbi:hypothetical protein WISP_64058 [Willisornis vidua]|uniref:Uncharacterized protein n=1 Tax=Willisornis vidua TaxID=1566151 RepID=A0ABQ9D9M0_9PASS|nr:hypothetical protein WISP_64058 [Willisornis vidua]